MPRSSAQASVKGRQARRRLAPGTAAGNVGGLTFGVGEGPGCTPAALAVKPLLSRPRDCAIYQDFDGRLLATEAEHREEEVPHEEGEQESDEERDHERGLRGHPGAIDARGAQPGDVVGGIFSALREQDEDVFSPRRDSLYEPRVGGERIEPGSVTEERLPDREGSAEGVEDEQTDRGCP